MPKTNKPEGLSPSEWIEREHAERQKRYKNSPGVTYEEIRIEAIQQYLTQLYITITKLPPEAKSMIMGKKRTYDDESKFVPTTELRVGMLRQWLNENRIADPKKLVTNEEIMEWLKL